MTLQPWEAKNWQVIGKDPARTSGKTLTPFGRGSRTSSYFPSFFSHFHLLVCVENVEEREIWKRSPRPTINPFFTNLQTKDHKLRSSFLFFWVICNLLSSVGLERIYLLALPPCLLKISLWDDMEVPEESFHWSSWDSRTCYPKSARTCYLSFVFLFLS